MWKVSIKVGRKKKHLRCDLLAQKRKKKTSKHVWLASIVTGFCSEERKIQQLGYRFMRACPSVDVSKRLRRPVCLSKRKKRTLLLLRQEKESEAQVVNWQAFFHWPPDRLWKGKCHIVFPFKQEENWKSWKSLQLNNTNNIKLFHKLSFKKSNKSTYPS